MYKSSTTESTKRSKILKADRKILQRLLNASNSGRDMQIAGVLKHELSPVPLSLANSSRKMNSTAKSQILNVLTTDLNVETPQQISVRDIATCVIIDSHTPIQSLGKTHDYKSSKKYANIFANVVFNNFSNQTTKVDIVFYRYMEKKSIKASSQSKWTGKRQPIHKVIDSPDVPLPQMWEQFMALDENKADLAEFLSHEMLSRTESLPDNCHLVVSGGFLDPANAHPNSFDAEELCIDHQEANTRIVIHSKHAINSVWSGC